MSLRANCTPAQVLIRLNPLFYAIDGFRYGMTGAAGAPPWLSALVLAATDLLLLLWAWAWLRQGRYLKS